MIADGLTPADRRALVERARGAVGRAVHGCDLAGRGGGDDDQRGDGGWLADGDGDGDGHRDREDGESRDGRQPPPALRRPAGVFVTLRVGGALRGCIGACEARAPLWNTVDEMAMAAATRDPRFPPISPADLRVLNVQISVLTPPRRVRSADDVVVGRHGVEVRRGWHHGLLLPQVATDHGLDRERFLAETCRKAGLPADAWRDPETELRVFEADVFGDAPGNG